MNSDLMFKFVREKLEALTGSPLLFPATGASIRKSDETLLRDIETEPKNSATRLKFFDKELDVTMRHFLPKHEITRISEELKSRYGFSSLSSTGETVARRALKRGRIVDVEEAQSVRDFVLNEDFAVEVFGRERVAKLEALLGKYEKERGA